MVGVQRKIKQRVKLSRRTLGYSLQLQQEQNFSLKQLFKGGDLLTVLHTEFGKSMIFLAFWLF